MISKKVADMKELLLNVGFSFFHILQRLKDIDSDACIDQTSKCLYFYTRQLSVWYDFPVFKQNLVYTECIYAPIKLH